MLQPGVAGFSPFASPLLPASVLAPSWLSTVPLCEDTTHAGPSIHEGCFHSGSGENMPLCTAVYKGSPLLIVRSWLLRGHLSTAHPTRSQGLPW